MAPTDQKMKYVCYRCDLLFNINYSYGATEIKDKSKNVFISMNFFRVLFYK